MSKARILGTGQCHTPGSDVRNTTHRGLSPTVLGSRYRISTARYDIDAAASLAHRRQNICLSRCVPQHVQRHRR